MDSLYESDLYDQEFLGVSSEFDLLIYQVLDFVFESNSFGIISDLGDYEFVTANFSEHSSRFRAR